MREGRVMEGEGTYSEERKLKGRMREYSVREDRVRLRGGRVREEKGKV